MKREFKVDENMVRDSINTILYEATNPTFAERVRQQVQAKVDEAFADEDKLAELERMAVDPFNLRGTDAPVDEDIARIVCDEVVEYLIRRLFSS